MTSESKLQYYREYARRRRSSDSAYRMYQNTKHRQYDNRNRAYARSYKESIGCVRCGLRDGDCLTLHHRNPEDKKFDISNAPKELERVIAEIKKCDVLCFNCHMKVHAEEDRSVRVVSVKQEESDQLELF